MGRFQQLKSTVLSTVLTLGLLLLTGVAAQTDGTVGSERDIFTGLLAGRDVSAAVAAYAESLEEVDKKWTDSDRFAPEPLGRSYQDALTAAGRQAGRLSRMDLPWQKSQALEDLLTSLNQLQGRQMIVEQRARQDLERLRKVDQAQHIITRGREAHQRFASTLAAIDVQIATVQSLPGKTVTSLEDEREWRAALKGVAESLKTLGSQNETRARPILRALPFDRPLISPGPLVTGPGVTPSYQQAEPQPGGSPDLAGTEGAPLSDAILAKAAELGNDYVAIHEFVRTQIRTEYYSGAMKGAETTLRTRSGNDVDQASLLIALYRASNVPARYVHGVARVSVEQAGAPLGLSDAQQVLTALSRAGIPHEPVIQGGQIGAVDVSATWVSIYVPYANYRGVPVDLAGRIWLPLAPAVKQYSFEPASGVAVASGLDGDALVTSYLADQVSDPPLIAARNQVEDYLAANPGLGSYEDQLGTVSVAAPSMKLLPAGIPFETVAVTEEAVELSLDRQQTLTLLVTDAGGQQVMNEQVPLSALLDKRLTLSYAPATVGDFNAIREFGGRTAVPAYLIRLKPQLKADGVAVATAEGDLGMGDVHTLTLELGSPGGTRTASATLTAGSYAAIGLSAQLGMPEVVSDAEALADDTESRAARLLYNQAARYASLWDEAEAELAGLFDLAVVRPLPALALVSTSVQVSQIQGLNDRVTFEAANLDAALRSVEPVSRSGDPLAESQWMRLAALQGSYLESNVFESQWAVESISADKGLRQAVRQTLPVAEIDAASAGSIIPGLSHPTEVIDAVQSAVDQGYRVLIPEGEISLNAWTGSVWHSWDPALGSSGYFISGGLAGGSTTEAPADWILDDLANVLGNPYGGEPNTDPNAAALIRIIPASDGQLGKAGEPLERPLTVLVTDSSGRPVQGAVVQFNVDIGDTELSVGSDSGRTIEVTTDSAGIAQATATLGISTKINPLYVFLEASDEFTTQISENWVSARVALASGAPLKPDRPFFFYTGPNDPAQLVGITSPPVAYPQAWAGPAQARLEDQYGNPVSNREIRYTALPAIPPDLNVCLTPVAVSPARLFTGDECPIPSTPGLDCGFPEVTVNSNAFGPFVQVVTGEGALGIGLPLEGRTRWPIEVSSPGVPSISFAVSTLESLTRNQPSAVTIVTRGTFDNILDSALVDEIAPAPRLALTFRADGGLCSPLSYGPDDADVAYRVVDRDEDGAFIINVVGTAPGIPVAPMEYEAYLPVGPEPIIHGANLDLTFALPSGSPVTTTSRTFGITAVEAEIVSVSPVPVPLNLNGETTEPIVVEYSALPANMRASLQINLLEDGNVIDFKFLARGPNVNTVEFAPGKTLDILKQYTVQLLVNPRTPFEIVTDPYPVEIIEPIVKSVTNIGSSNRAVDSASGGGLVVGGRVRVPLSFFNDIDIPNERVCRRADIFVELTQPAAVSMSFERLDIDNNPTGQIVDVLSSEALPAGSTRVEVSADDLGTDNYAWIINAVSDLDSSVDLVGGSAGSSFITRNSLPIAHPTTMGVDLATGKMVASFQDFDIPGLGANLKFKRTYASGNRAEPGVLGSGWNHNYASRIVRSNCGDYYLSGADAGTIRFLSEGGGFTPLKGYHGTLTQDPEDGAFDFYTRAGFRYHFTARQADAWWLDYIEDPNGNRTTLTYEPGVDAPKVTTVTDASGRQLNFSYESRSFRNWSGDVVVNIQGPGGITLDFEYDDFGNQISATRESAAHQHTYQYLTDSNPGNANLLVAYTDEVFSATRQYEYSEVTISTPFDTGTLDVLSSVVDAITEPDGGRFDFQYQPGPWGMNQQATVTNPGGATTTYVMNDYGAATSISLPNGTQTMTWETETDVLMLSETDENGRLKTMSYDADANVIQTDVGSYTSAATFTPIGMIKTLATSTTDFRGQLSTFTYDGSGNVLSESLDGITTNHSYDASGSRRTTTDPNGNTITYTYDGNGYLTSQTDPEGNTRSFTWDARGRKLTETDPNGNQTRFRYDNRDRLIRKDFADGTNTRVLYDDSSRAVTAVDQRGNATRTTRDAMGRVVQVRNAVGDVATKTYDQNGNKLTETDFAGRLSTLTYDGANRLTGSSEPEGRTISYVLDGVGNVTARTVTGTGGSRTHSYTFDPSLYFQTSETTSGLAAVIQTRDGAGNLLTETDPEGRLTTSTYDAFNRVLTRSGPRGSGFERQYDAVGNLLVETRKNSTGDQVRRSAYDGANRPVQMIDAEGAISSVEYDSVGNITREVDARGKETRHIYDNRNRRIRSIGPTGATIDYGYDGKGNLVSEMRPSGNVVTNVFDVLDRKTESFDSIGPMSTQTYDAMGNVLTKTDGNGNLTTMVYDDLNRLISTTKPGGRTSLTQYNAFDEKISETDPAGSVISHTYNALGHMLSISGPEGLSLAFTYDLIGNALTETDSLGRVVTKTYDDLNYLVSAEDPLYSQSFSLDLLGNRTGSTDRRGLESQWAYDLENRQTRFVRAGVVLEERQYDASGNLLFLTDANGNTVGYEYDDRNLAIRENRPELAITMMVRDASGDIVTEQGPAGRTIQRSYDLRRRESSMTDSLGLTTSYQYDLNNNRTQMARPLSSWTYEYDEADRLVAATDSLGNRTAFEYDTRGNQTAMTDANGRLTTFSHDARNRIVGKEFPGGAVLGLAYDANNNLVQRTEPNGTVVDLTYDELDREVTQTTSFAMATVTETRTYDGNSNLLSVSETNSAGPGGVSSNTYDDFGRATSVTNRLGRRIQYQYDDNGNRTNLLDHDNQITTYTYDGLNRLSTMAVPGLGTFSYDYLANSLVNAIDYPNGARSVFEYDLGDRMTRVTNTQGGETVVEFNHQFDANSNRTEQQQIIDGNTELTTYTYDGADRMTAVAYPDRTVTYLLDNVGNRISETTTLVSDGSSVARTLDYNLRDQLTDIVDSGGTTITFNYDPNGNQIERVAGNTLTFEYSPRNRLVSVLTDGVLSARFEYDHDGLRLAKESGGSRIEYVYDQTAQIAQTNALGNTVARYYYGSTRRLASSGGGVNRYILHDALRSPVAITDQSGALLTRYGYDAWGNIDQQSGSDDYPFGFSGMVKDDEAGLYYAGARYYDPEIGRFLSEDPVEGNPDSPPSLHRYLYAAANPTAFTDPDGLAFYGFDGTSADRDDEDTVNPSNVAKIFDLYQGVKFYQPGVGTNDGIFGNIAGLGGGYGGDRRLEEMYWNLVYTYNGVMLDDNGNFITIEPDKNIDIAGFSRGAALARAFANMIYERGIPDLRSRRLRITGEGPYRRQEVVFTNYIKPDIRSLAIFDTVGSFGQAGDADEGNKDLSIAPNVQNVRHAIARHELRVLFPLTSAVDPSNPFDPRIVETIFQGVHSDSGGTYPDDDSLSHDALWWMYHELEELGAPLADFPRDQLPVLPSQALPPRRVEHITRSGNIWYTYEPVQGGRTQHDSRMFGIGDNPRKIIYRYNRRPLGQEDDIEPFEPFMVSGPIHFLFLRLIYDDPYWIITEDYEEP